MRTRCLEPGCRDWTHQDSRCRLHLSEYNARRSATSNARRKARLATGDGAARRARTALRKAGNGECAHCREVFAADALDVDHIVPLSKGGLDVSSNLQLLCKQCHMNKTASDRRNIR
ncbi:HNH endonuclease [Streptomyces microflavus]|uniref:HNH endonuclease n=1 Tax=Streptomyces microflavus TaxID=1919 RepID=UPI00380C1330